MDQSLQLKPFSGDLDASPTGFKPFSGDLDKVQNKSFAGDTVTDIKRGIEQLPGAVTGLTDIINPLTYVTGQRMADTAANWIGDKTGFKPSQWAKDAEAEYSPERKASDQAINRAWDKGGIGDIAGSYLSNPRSVAGVVAQSLPSVVGGGAIARGAMKGIAALSGADMAALSSAAKLEGSAGEAARNTINRMATTAAGIGEGAITAGQNMDQVSRDEDPRTAALTSAAAGVVTGTIGKVSGRVANKLGLPDVETAMAGGGLGAGSMPWYKRIPSSMVQESLLQELPQSAQEQVWQNIAEGKPWHEGVARQAIEGALAGAAMGGGVAALPQGKMQEAPHPAPPAQEIDGLPQAPANTGTPNDQVQQSEVERAYDAAVAERAAFEAANPQAPAKLPEAGPLSAVVNLGIDSGATTLAPPVAPPAPALRERDFVPPPAGSFGQMSEFAGLLDSERADAEARKQALVAGQQLRKDSALESTDARVADARTRESNQRRDALLASVLDTMPEGQNPARAFGRALREQGFTDTFFRPEETARIAAWKNIAREAPAPDVIPSAPNELDPAALGIKERPAVTPEEQKQRAIEANKQRLAQTRARIAGQKAAQSTQEAPRGNVAPQETNAQVSAPGAQAASSELPGSAGVLAPAPAGDAGRTGNRAEVAAPGVRPAGTAGDTGAQDVIRDYPKGQAMALAGRLSHQGLPSEAYPHPTIADAYAIRAKTGEQDAVSRMPGSKSPEAGGQPAAARADVAQAVVAQQAAAQGPEQQPAAAVAPAATKPPNRQRNDLVGAILRVTGGYGINPAMAQTLTGDKANGAAKLRGLFTARGQSDMDDLASMLREAEGYDVADGNALAELIRRQASGERVTSMETQQEEAAANAEKQYRNDIRERAAKLGIKTVARKFGEIEQAVMAAEAKQAAESSNEAEAERLAIQAESAVAEMDDATINELMRVAASETDGRYLDGQWITDEAILAGLDASAALAEREEQAGADGAGETVTGEAGGNRQERGQEARPDFGLSQQTNAELAAREAEVKAREEAVVKQEQEAEQRRKADAERADFGLTGSDRQADVGAARGQGDIFSQSATPKETAQKLSKPAEDAKPAIEAPKKAEEPGNVAMFSRPTAPEINPHLVKWATSVLDKARGIAPVMPIMREPSAVLNLAGIYRPIVIDMEHAGHAMNVHPEISPEDIGALPDLLKRPRAILKHKNGWRLLVDSRDGKGNPLSVALTNDLITSGKDRLKVTEVSTMFGKDDSAAYLVKEIESGNVIYMPEKEIGRLLELLSAPQLRTQDEESQPPTNQISDRTFNLLSDESLVNFQKDPKGGWASNTTSITLPANASEILHGEHFSRSGSATGQTVAAVRAEVSAKIGKMKLAILERKGLVRIHADISTMPAAAQKHPDTWGYFDGKTMHLVAGNLEAGQAAGIFQHEAWHAALRSLKLSESPLYQKIMDRLGKIERNGVVAKWFEEGYQMIPREDRQNDAKRLNEMAAYAIQQYENEPKSLPLLIRRFVEDLIASVRAFFMENLGWVPENLTAADLAALTRRYVDEMASGETMVGPMGEAMAARLEDQGKAGSVLGMNEPGASAGSGVKFSKPHNDGLQSDYELPNKPSIHRAIDGADLTALRRAAAGLERTRDSIFLRVSEDGNAIATGPKGTRIPDTFRRFANDHDLAFYAERRVPRAPDAIMGEGSSTSSMDIGIARNSEPMPIVYRESGARYFGEDVGEALDRSDKTRFSRPRFSVSGQQIQQAWKNPDNLGPWDNFVRAMQDKLIDTKRIVEEIRKAGIAIKDELDPYLQEILYHGRAAARVNDFSERELNPMLVEMSMRGIQTPEARQAFEDYLWAQHAPERNAQIAKVNAKMPDGGSGLTNQQAADVMAGQTVNVGGRDVKLDMTKLAAYQSLAKRVAAINKGTTDTLVRYGLETQETVDAWRKTYGHYVPLMRDMEADDNYAGALGLGLGTGQGFSVRGSAAKRAMGSERGVIDILANVAMQRERAIVRGEKNRVSQALYGLSLAAPNPDFWIPINPDSGKDPQAVIAELVAMGVNPVDAANIANEPKQQYIDPRTGMVAERVNPQLRSRPDVLAVRVDGKDRYVMFSSDERAQQMVRNLKNLDAEQLGVVMQNAAVVTRWFASINTQFNPVFGLTNGVRDLGTASLNLSSTELKNDRAAVLAGAFSALRGIYSDLRDHRAGRTPTSKWALIFEDFAQEGGQTGYRDMFQTSAARTEALASELKNAGKGQRWLAWGEKHSHIFGWLSDYNTSIENAVRVSAYKVALDKGMSKQQAASLAKNLTVNFNKKGLAATQAGAMYAFFNAAVQGSARIGQTMIRIENGKPSLTSAGKTILYGGMMAGVMQALMFSLAGYDDDEPPQFAREKNFIIPLPDGKYISIPYPLGFHVIPGIGRIGAEFALSGFKKPGKRMTDMASMIMDGFNPIGGTSGSLTQMLSPTVVDPIVALNENKDWTGKSIFKEDFNKMHPTAGWTRTKDTASDFSKTIAYAVNYVTGGGKYEIGMLSPTPDQIDYLIGQATGGVGREALKAYQFAKTETSGEDMPMYKVPVAGRFIGETTGQASETSRFYENLKRIGEHKSALDEMRRAKDMPAMVEYMREHPDARMVKIADRASSEIGDLKKIKRDALKRDANAGQIRLIEARIGNRVTAWNALLKEKQDQ